MEHGLFGHQRLLLTFLSASSYRPGAVLGVVVTGMGLSFLKEFAVHQGDELCIYKNVLLEGSKELTWVPEGE